MLLPPILYIPYMVGQAQRIQNGQAPKSTAPMDDVSIDAPSPPAALPWKFYSKDRHWEIRRKH
jgi:hypothetical protein